MPQYPQYTEIAKEIDILYCELKLEAVNDQVQIYLISELYLRGSEGRATCKVDLSSYQKKRTRNR